MYVVTVDEGPRYRFGKVAWIGNTRGADKTNSRAHGRRGTWSPYDASAIERAQGEAYAAYAERGYLYLDVEPRETVRDSMVDVEFHVGEGQPSNVRYINITGNKGTREKVIRRELSIHEGDRFRRSALVRTQGDLMRLGLFEDVQMDFTPAESTDVDSESQGQGEAGRHGVGRRRLHQPERAHRLHRARATTTCSATVRCSQLHLERGGTQLELPAELHRAVVPRHADAARHLGLQPQRWCSTTTASSASAARLASAARCRIPDYSRDRGRLPARERHLRFAAGRGRDQRAGQHRAGRTSSPGKPRRTSGAISTFNRNTANNPFYPTHGTRLALTSEFAGGPFGGTVNYTQAPHRGARLRAVAGRAA